jgi:hypothetical protein
MPDRPVQPPDSAWIDEDVEEARRKANRRSALLALLVFVSGLLFAIADHLSQPTPGTPTPSDLIAVLRIGGTVVAIAAFFVFFLAMSAWLNLMQRRGGREPDQGDIV